VLGLASPATTVAANAPSVAEALVCANLAAMVVELRAEPEGAGDHQDLELLAERLSEVAEWLAINACAGASVGLMGAAEVGEAALVVAATRPQLVRAVVCASALLDRVSTAATATLAPTLLVLGERDARAVMASARLVPHMRCERRVELVRGCGARLDAPSALRDLTTSAVNWLRHHLGSAPDDEPGVRTA